MSGFVVVESEPTEHYGEEVVAAVHGAFATEADAFAFAKTLGACEGTVWLAPISAPGAGRGKVKHVYFPGPVQAQAGEEPFIWEDRYPEACFK
jgi:hypothetical protein